MSIAVGLSVAWAAACIYEWGTGRRVLPWNPYAGCGATQPAELPATVRIGLYEEFPAPWRLERLKYIDFPVTLAVAAPSRTIFMKLRDTIMRQYPQVREVLFWPLLSAREGYYPGTWSDAGAIQRVAGEAQGSAGAVGSRDAAGAETPLDQKLAAKPRMAGSVAAVAHRAGAYLALARIDGA